MISEEIIKKFNENSDYDYIDYKYLSCDYKGCTDVLICQYYYVLPLVERLCRQLLHKQELTSANIETIDNRYRTLNSIIMANEKLLTELIGEDAMICIKDIFSEEGIRNKVLHNKPINITGIHKYELASSYKWLLGALESLLKCYIKINKVSSLR